MVSIIVPVFNRENYIKKCVNFILSQTYKNIEVILVNDGSTDNSLKLMKEIAVTDNRVKIIDKKASGVSSTVAAGVENSTGDFIAFVDSDDYVGDKFIQNFLDTIGDYDVVCMGYYEDNGEIISKEIVDGVWENDSLKPLMTDWRKMPCVRWNKIYKKNY